MSGPTDHAENIRSALAMASAIRQGDFESLVAEAETLDDAWPAGYILLCRMIEILVGWFGLEVDREPDEIWCRFSLIVTAYVESGRFGS